MPCRVVPYHIAFFFSHVPVCIHSECGYLMCHEATLLLSIALKAFASVRSRAGSLFNNQ